jgi:hypothetical protein
LSCITNVAATVKSSTLHCSIIAARLTGYDGPRLTGAKSRQDSRRNRPANKKRRVLARHARAWLPCRRFRETYCRGDFR